jgi:hypothetical protein
MDREKQKLWILGAPDPEMEMIETVLREHGQEIAHAVVYVDDVSCQTRRVRPDEAYSAALMAPLRLAERVAGYDDGDVTMTSAVVYGTPGGWQDVCQSRHVVLVECDLANPDRWGASVTVVDHHRPGDPGYGRPPAEYLPASSLGQVLALLEVEPTSEQWMIAAADHCLAAAYRSECPGVDPDELGRWRAESRAKFQGRAVEAVMADVEAARIELARAPKVCACCGTAPCRPEVGSVADLRGRCVSELPEAAAREGIAFLATPRTRPGERTKMVLQAASPEQVTAFLSGGAATLGLVDIYGDPARGFAGGYVA